MQWRRNADKDLRDLERRYQISNDVADWKALENARRRAGMETWTEQAAECERRIQQVLEIQNRTFLLPEIRHWHEMFEKTQPSTGPQVKMPVPKNLQHLSYSDIKKWLVDNWEALTPWYPKNISLTADHKIISASEYSRGEAPLPPWGERWDFTEYDGQNRFTYIGPTCAVDQGNSLYVRASQPVYAALKETMLPDANDNVFFKITFWKDSPKTMLISAAYNTIIGSRWLSVLPQLEFPYLLE